MKASFIIIAAVFAAALGVVALMACGGTWPRTIDIHIGADGGISDAGADR